MTKDEPRPVAYIVVEDDDISVRTDPEHKRLLERLALEAMGDVVIVGGIGHIDHGKSTLVAALNQAQKLGLLAAISDPRILIEDRADRLFRLRDYPVTHAVEIETERTREYPKDSDRRYYAMEFKGNRKERRSRIKKHRKQRR